MAFCALRISFLVISHHAVAEIKKPSSKLQLTIQGLHFNDPFYLQRGESYYQSALLWIEID